MTEWDEQARTHLEKALDAEGGGPWIHLGAAGVFAVLHLADTIRHGLRDIMYEMRD